MNNIYNQHDVELAKLDGYLSGISAMDGNIRDFSANAFKVDRASTLLQTEQSLQNFFSSQATLSAVETHKLEGGLRDLEGQIKDYLIRSSLFLGVQNINAEAISKRKKYLSFRIMDMIMDLIGDDQLTMVVKLNVDFLESESLCVFFCLLTNNSTYVLQFNDDRPFKA